MYLPAVRAFWLRFSEDMALLSEGVSANAMRGYSGTYVHLGRKAATIWAS
jgi:hypothetical protein